MCTHQRGLREAGPGSSAAALWLETKHPSAIPTESKCKAPWAVGCTRKAREERCPARPNYFRKGTACGAARDKTMALDSRLWTRRLPVLEHQEQALSPESGYSPSLQELEQGGMGGAGAACGACQAYLPLQKGWLSLFCAGKCFAVLGQTANCNCVLQFSDW